MWSPSSKSNALVGFQLLDSLVMFWPHWLARIQCSFVSITTIRGGIDREYRKGGGTVKAVTRRQDTQDENNQDRAGRTFASM